MKIIFVLFLAVILLLSILLIIWGAWPRLVSVPADQRIKRSVGAGIGVVGLIMSSFLLYGVFNNEEGKLSIAAIQGLCILLFCAVFWGSVATVSIFYQTQHSERMLRDGLNGAVELFEKSRKSAKNSEDESRP